MACSSRPSEISINDSSATSSSVEIDTLAVENVELPDRKIPSDTISIDYLKYAANSGQGLNYTWIKKLDQIGDFFQPLDPASMIEINRIWTINDSIAALELSHYTGVSVEIHLLTFKNRRDFISKLLISSQGDRDLSSEYYSYTEHRTLNDKEVELSIHEIIGPDESEKETVMKEKWAIQDNGQIIKIK